MIENRKLIKCRYNLRKTAPKASRKHEQSIPKFFKNDLYEKSTFAILSMRNNDFEVPDVEKS